MMQSSEPAARALFSSSDEEPEPAVDLFERVVILKPRPLLCVCSLSAQRQSRSSSSGATRA